MCKPGKSFNTGVKTSYLSSHEDALQKKQPCRRGSAPYRRSDWTSRLWAMSKVGLFKMTVRWTLTLETNHLWSLGPCQCRNTTEQRLQRRAFPVTSRSRGSPKEHEPTTWHPKQRTELKRNQSIQPASTTDSKYNKQSVFILTKLVNSIWMQ